MSYNKIIITILAHFLKQVPTQKHTTHLDTEIRGSLVSEPKHWDSRFKSRIEIGMEIQKGPFLIEISGIRTEMPRLLGQDSELSRNGNRVLSLCSFRTGIGIKF